MTATFGAFPNAILVGNFGDGTIDALDINGKFLGQLTNSSNKLLVNRGLWDMAFGGGGPSGASGTLYLTAGGSNEPNFPTRGSTTRVFARLTPSAAGQNFSLTLSTQSVSVAPDGTANVTISAAAVGGLDSPISPSCSTPAGVTCSFSPTTITPGSGAVPS